MFYYKGTVFMCYLTQKLNILSVSVKERYTSIVALQFLSVLIHYLNEPVHSFLQLFYNNLRFNAPNSHFMSFVIKSWFVARLCAMEVLLDTNAG